MIRYSVLCYMVNYEEVHKYVSAFGISLIAVPFEP
jgi:hypothetical protein